MLIFWNHFFLAGGAAASGAGVGAGTMALGVGRGVFAAGTEPVTTGLGAPVAGWVEDCVLGFEAGTGAFTTGLGVPAC